MGRPRLVVYLIALVGAIVTGAIVTGATASSGADPGITARTILLGGTAPLSDPASAAVARGADAYFKYVNARGGVDGRSIAFTVVDDGSSPTQAVEATRQLVEEDGVFAIVNSLGTEANLATRGYLNGLKVPQLFVGSGASTFGREHRRYPATIGFRPTYRAEGRVYGAYLARTKPRARVAVLFQNDTYGRELLAGLREGIGRSTVRVVVAEGYAPASAEVQAQLGRLNTGGADTLALFSSPGIARVAAGFAARPGWRPLLLVSADASDSAPIEGAISIAYLKDPREAAWRADPALRVYRAILARYARGANPGELGHVRGMAVAYETVRLLRAVGATPTRAAVVTQLARLRDASNPFLLPGIVVRTSATERFPVEQAQLRRHTRGSWKRFGGLWNLSAG